MVKHTRKKKINTPEKGAAVDGFSEENVERSKSLNQITECSVSFHLGNTTSQ